MTADTTQRPMSDSGPRPPDLSTALKLVGVGRVWQRRFDDELGDLGLTMRHFGALGHLSRNPELSYSDLARRAHVTSQSMNATVRHLEDLGAVHRHSAGPGHPARLEVTETGRQLLLAARAAAQRLDAQIESDLGADSRHALDRILDELMARSIAATVAAALDGDRR